jgi:hypothetical protein
VDTFVAVGSSSPDVAWWVQDREGLAAMVVRLQSFSNSMRYSDCGMFCRRSINV